MCKTHPHWFKEEQFLLSPLTDSQLAILRVHLTPYRSRATVAALNHIAAAARAAKVVSQSSISQRQLSFQASIPRECVATSDCTASYRRVTSQSQHKDALHPFRLLSRFYRSRPLASRPSAPRASANDAFALVYALRQALSHKYIPVGVNLLLLLQQSHRLITH